jgi:hypothetical protein
LISDTAQNLEANLKQVAEEKQTTESKWKEERQRRIKTEKRLRLAEDSLKRLDRALKESGVQIDLQIETDVKNLKKFFEDCIAEEQFEAQKLGIMRDAVRAKATYNTTSQHLEKLAVRESPVPPPTPEDAPLVKPSSETGNSNGAENGETGGERPEVGSSATEVVANGDAAGKTNGEISEVIANGDAGGASSEGAEVVENGHDITNGAAEANETNSEAVCAAASGDKGGSGNSDAIENGVP